MQKIKWYLKYRTQIWSTIFMIVGLLGGSTATVYTYVPSLKYKTDVIEKQIERINQISEQLKKLQKSIDKLEK